MPAIAGKSVEPTSCLLCEFSSKRITTVEKHILTVHGITAKQAYDDKHGVKLCKCGCGQETTWLNIKAGYSELLRGHNASIYNVYDPDEAARIAKTRGKNWRDNPWSKGLTKETDERIANRATATSIGRLKGLESGKITIWSKGLTKETDERLALLSQNAKLAFSNGERKAWSKGLTKETDEKIKKMSIKVSLTHKEASLRTRLDELKRLSTEEVKSRVEADGSLTLISVDGYVNNRVQNIHVKCNTCGETTCRSLKELQNNRCYNCDPVGSTVQVQIASYIKSLGFDVAVNARDVIPGDHRGAELDIFVPSKNVAIEYNGLYWHCSLHKSDVYHQNKTMLCNERGIKLFHIFQDEWSDNVDVVKAMIRHSLGMSTKLGARECKIVTVHGDVRRKFFEENHLDGDVPASYAIGLEHDGDVVMMISLRRPFHKKYKSFLEVARLATKRDLIVMGGLSRLTKHALKLAKMHGINSLLTYVDNRLGSSTSWERSGWKIEGQTAPRFWWTDFKERFDRFKYRADRSRNMSELDVAIEANVVKIYGCRNTVLTCASN